MIIFGAPRRYVQGPGTVESIGSEVARLGSSAVLVAGETVLSLVGSSVASSCRAVGVALHCLRFGGDVTTAEILRLADQAAVDSPDVVIAAGGGKGIDAGKGLCARLGARLITMPTAASNDSSTSHIIVLYDQAHRLSGVERMKTNPDTVVVDTAIIARAPLTLLRAGIGDAIAKQFEAQQCSDACGLNLFGGTPPKIAIAIAKACYQILRTDAVAALKAAERQIPDPAFERVVEACLLMSGLAFESGGLSISHAMTRGLTAIESTAKALHGYQVAYGLLVQLILEEVEPSFLHDMIGFFQLLGLPTCLADLGLESAGQNALLSIAQPTINAPYIKHFRRHLSMSDLVKAMQSLEASGR